MSNYCRCRPAVMIGDELLCLACYAEFNPQPTAAPVTERVACGAITPPIALDSSNPAPQSPALVGGGGAVSETARELCISAERAGAARLVFRLLIDKAICNDCASTADRFLYEMYPKKGVSK